MSESLPSVALISFLSMVFSSTGRAPVCSTSTTFCTSLSGMLPVISAELLLIFSLTVGADSTSSSRTMAICEVLPVMAPAVASFSVTSANCFWPSLVKFISTLGRPNWS